MLRSLARAAVGRTIGRWTPPWDSPLLCRAGLSQSSIPIPPLEDTRASRPCSAPGLLTGRSAHVKGSELRRLIVSATGYKPPATSIREEALFTGIIVKERTDPSDLHSRRPTLIAP